MSALTTDLNLFEGGNPCDSCQLYKRSQCKNPFLKPFGALNARYIVVADQPLASDDSKGRLFSSAGGQRFNDVLRAVGFDLTSILYTSALRCYPRGVTLNNEAKICGQYVQDLIEKHQPDGMILLGSNALKAVFPNAYSQVHSIHRVRGVHIPYFTRSGKQVTCVATFSLMQAASFIDDTTLQVWYDDLGSILSPKKITVDLNPRVVLCKDIETVNQCISRLKIESVVAFDYETTDLKPYRRLGRSAEIYSAAFAFADGTSYAIPFGNFFPTNIRSELGKVMGSFFYDLNPHQTKIAHNAKFDMLWGLYKFGEKLNRAPCSGWEDTSLLCWIEDERQSMSKLKVAAWRYFGVDDWSVDVKDITQFSIDEILQYNALDAFYTLRLYQHLEPIVCNTTTGKSLYREVLLPAMLQFMKVEMRGVQIDESVRSQLQKTYQSKMEASLSELRSMAQNDKLNPRSSKQLQSYFLKKCQYRLVKTTKTGWSMDDEVLHYIKDRYDDPVAKAIIDYRGLSKLQSTYIEGLSKHIYDDSCLHAGFNLTATVTGRTSSSQPNLQNFPIRRGSEVRTMVVPPSGHKFCSFDYGQIEARLFAISTGDKQYIDDLMNGYDIHTEMALAVFADGLGWDREKAKEQRSAIKTGLVFPAFYGAGVKNIAQNLSIPDALARKHRDLIFERYPKIKKWQKQIINEEQESGFVESLYGRRRRSPMSYTEILNHTTQSTASDITLSAMNLLGRKYKIAFMIHDELSFFIPDTETLTDALCEITHVMLVVPWLHLVQSKRMKAFAPLQVKCSIGDNWGEQETVLSIDSIEAGYPTLQTILTKARQFQDEFLSMGW